MAPFRVTILVTILGLAGVFPSSNRAQTSTEPNQEQQAANRRVLKILQEPLVDTGDFQMVLPLAKFLEALEKQLPPGKKISLGIDREAFGNKFAEVAASPINLRLQRVKTSLETVLATILRGKMQLDYRIDASGVTITTPARALYTTTYDLQDILGKPATLRFTGPALWNGALGTRERNRRRETLQTPDWVVQQIATSNQVARRPTMPYIQVLNGTGLVIRANAATHLDIEALLAAIRRQNEVAVAVITELHEVDYAFYTRLKNAKPIDWEEAERQFVDGVSPKGESLFKLLNNQTRLQAGATIRVTDGADAALLSRHQAVNCLLEPDQIRMGEQGPQTLLEGVSFLAEIHVSGDRRHVNLKITEKAAEVRHIKKVRVVVDNTGKEANAEIPMLTHAVHAQVQEIGDGGSILLPVHYRPRSIQEKERWWVLMITSRIIIEEEERMMLQGDLEVLPGLLADLLTNPRLKATREFFGTPGDTRCALVDSDAWTWPEKIDLPGHQRVAANRAGKRLLGIRIDKIDWPVIDNEKYSFKVTLVNAGGSANGAVFGGCTIHYTARPLKKGWTVELAEPRGP